MTWSVVISGNKGMLQSLSESTNPEFSIRLENNEWILRSISFEEKTQESEVRELASAIISSLNGILACRYEIPTAIKLNSIVRRNEKGGRDIFLNVEPLVFKITGFEPTLILTRANGEQIVSRPSDDIFNQLSRIQSNPKAAKIHRLIQNGDWEFANLHKIIEILLSEKGSKLYDWVAEEKVDLLKRTANHEGAIGDKARHGVSRTEPPPNPMSLSEAQKITKLLIEKYIMDLS